MAVFRTLVRHRKVKVVFLSEAKISSSDFTFIVNIKSRFVVCTLIYQSQNLGITLSYFYIAIPGTETLFNLVSFGLLDNWRYKDVVWDWLTFKDTFGGWHWFDWSTSGVHSSSSPIEIFEYQRLIYSHQIHSFGKYWLTITYHRYVASILALKMNWPNQKSEINLTSEGGKNFRK